MTLPLSRPGLRLILGLSLALSPFPALGHGQPVPIELWGPFLPETVRCLREVSRAAHACFDTVFAAEQRCRDALARGATCDRAAVDAEIESFTATMRGAAAAACNEGQLTEIGYFGFFDANADLVNACALQAAAAATAIYAPAAGSGAAPAAAACMAASAAYGRKVMWSVLQRQAPIMERFATRVFAAEDKQEIARRSEAELSATRSRWVAGLLEACPDFDTVYDTSAESLLRTLKQRADCVLSKTYVNSAVVCPSQ